MIIKLIESETMQNTNVFILNNLSKQEIENTVQETLFDKIFMYCLNREIELESLMFLFNSCTFLNKNDAEKLHQKLKTIENNLCIFLTTKELESFRKLKYSLLISFKNDLNISIQY